MSLYVSCEILTCGGIVIVNCDVVCGRGHTSTGTGHTSTGTGHTSTGTGHTSTGTGHTTTGTGHTSTGIQKQEGRLSCYVRYYRLSQAREKLSS